MNELAKPVLEGDGAVRTTSATCAPTSCCALQKGADEWVHRDELLFQTVHQSSELWLKLALERGGGGGAGSSPPTTSRPRTGCCAARATA